jgi:hypothetical protein
VKYKAITYIIFFVVSFFIGLAILQNIPASEYIQRLGPLGYVGAIVAGILVTYTLTSSLGLILILAFTHVLPLIPLALVTSIGMSLAEYAIFRTSQYTVTTLPKKTSSRFFKRIPKWFLKKNNYLVLVAYGILLLLLPLPYEFAMSILGITRITTIQFLLFTYILNVISFLIVIHILIALL